jgi:DNA replication protein DnaD
MERANVGEPESSTPKNAAQDKWGDALQAGFQVVPNILIQAHKEIGLDPLDVLILLNMNMHWWSATSLPYPKPALLAARIGVTRRTIERRINAMQKAGLITRRPSEVIEGRGTTVQRFSLDGLVKKLSQLAGEAVTARGRIRPGTVEDSG